MQDFSPVVFLMSLTTSSLFGTNEGGLSFKYLFRASSPSQRMLFPGLHGTWNQSPRTRQLLKIVKFKKLNKSSSIPLFAVEGVNQRMDKTEFNYFNTFSISSFSNEDD